MENNRKELVKEFYKEHRQLMQKIAEQQDFLDHVDELKKITSELKISGDQLDKMRFLQSIADDQDFNDVCVRHGLKNNTEPNRQRPARAITITVLIYLSDVLFGKPKNDATDTEDDQILTAFFGV